MKNKKIKQALILASLVLSVLYLQLALAQESNNPGNSAIPKITSSNIRQISPVYTEDQKIEGSVNKPGIEIEVIVNENKKYSGASSQDPDRFGNYPFSVDVVLEKKLRVSDAQRHIDLRTYDSWENNIRIIARDSHGREASLEEILVLSQCGYGTDWSVELGEITPEKILPEHLANGIAQISFPVKLSYKGPGDASKAKIIGQPALSEILASPDTYENYAIHLFPGYSRGYWNRQYSEGLFVISLNAWQGSLEDLHEMDYVKIPLRLDINYETETEESGIKSHSHKECITLTLMLDSEAPADKIPGELIKESAAMLDSAKNLAQTFKEPIESAEDLVSVLCIAAESVRAFKAASAEVACAGVREIAAEALIEGRDSCSDSRCDLCLYALKDLKETERMRNYICNRILCPKVPTLENHRRTYIDSVTRKNVCSEMSIDEARASGKCEQEYRFAWESVFLLIDEWDRAVKGQADTDSGVLTRILQELDFCRIAEGHGIEVVFADPDIYLIDRHGNVRMASHRTDHGNDFGAVIIKEDGSRISYNYMQEDEFSGIGPGGYLRIDEEGYFIFHYQGRHLYLDREGNIQDYSEDVSKESIKRIDPNVLSKISEIMENDYLLDPHSDIIRSVQAVCLPGIESWLSHWENIIESVGRCFNESRIKGEKTPAECRALLSTYVCDMVYDAILCTSSQPEDSGLEQITATGYDDFVTHKALINSVCLFAFTGDWGELDLAEILIAEAEMPALETQAILFPSAREFIGPFYPEQGRAEYAYHIGAGIAAGRDLSYRIYLKCSSGSTCEGPCDCYYFGEEREINIASGSLRKGQTFNQNFYHKASGHPVRYDQSVIEWEWTDTAGTKHKSQISASIREIGPGTPENCRFDTRSNEFLCIHQAGVN